MSQPKQATPSSFEMIMRAVKRCDVCGFTVGESFMYIYKNNFIIFLC